MSIVIYTTVFFIGYGQGLEPSGSAGALAQATPERREGGPLGRAQRVNPFARLDNVKVVFFIGYGQGHEPSGSAERFCLNEKAGFLTRLLNWSLRRL